jgi:glycosyltransferase involved in cell wall biosynthesis
VKNLISIVIPCKNEAEEIQRTLGALEEQSMDMCDVPVYIADAGSRDSTLSIIQDYIENSRLKIEVVQGGYPPTGRNIGASRCTSEFILFMDADIQLGESSTLQKSVELALRRELDLVATYIKCRDGNKYDRFFWEKVHAFTYKYPYIVGPYAAGMFILIRRSRFRELGGFNEKMILGDDWDLTHRIPRKKFGVADTFIWTSNRRFVQQGYLKTFSRYFRVAISREYRTNRHSEYSRVWD